MLNPELYNALKAAYKSVDIYCEDEQMVLNRMPVRSATMGRSGTKVTSDMIEEGGEYYAVNCPFCGDTRHRLWVCYAWGSPIEINGQKLQVSRGVVHCYNEHCTNNHENWVKFCKSIDGQWKPSVVAAATESERLNSENEATVEMPAGNYYVDDPHADPTVIDYLRNDRQCDITELRFHWDFRIAKIDFYDRPVIIMPVVCEGKYRFWQARYPIEGKIPEFFRDGRRKPKYYIPAGAKKSRVLYNFDRACQMADVIVLVEGIFDAVRIGASGVAMFGKKPSTRQQTMLVNNARNKTIVWIPDMDDPEALEYARDYTARWNNAGLFKGGAHILTLPDGDPADYTREVICSSIVQLLVK